MRQIFPEEQNRVLGVVLIVDFLSLVPFNRVYFPLLNEIKSVSLDTSIKDRVSSLSLLNDLYRIV